MDRTCTACRYGNPAEVLRSHPALLDFPFLAFYLDTAGKAITQPFMQILGISGSLRTTSFNSGLLRAAGAELPSGVTMLTASLADIPLYNGDLDVEGGPEPVRLFKQHIAAADALLIATPEYNWSLPGVLKNAIDWASRPPRTSVLNGKPVAMMGVGGISGTMRAQLQLRQLCVACNMLALNRPLVQVQSPKDKFDEGGNLTDAQTRTHVRELVSALVAWTERVAG